MLADIFRHRKIDVDILDHKDLIKVAAAYGHLDIVMQYLEKVSTQTDRSSTIHQFILAAVRCRGKSILSHFADEVNNVSSRLYWICRQSNGDELIHYDKYCKTLITEESMSHQYEDDYYFTPLMIAIKYRRVQCIKKLVQKIQDNDITDLLLNAAKKKNVNVIDNDMMGNTPVHICAQLAYGSIQRRACMIDEADTPMRKLIISMPDMAYKVLDRCTTMLGADGTKLHKNNFDYEFLEDQFAIRNWMKGKKKIGNEKHSKMNMLPCSPLSSRTWGNKVYDK
ncbi:unnamed protein product [Rotaria sordida]|nr:unnamed protein product [Rotaria sordida]CAF4033631.1 unnamed protein product [Rotaria sordida]